MGHDSAADFAMGSNQFQLLDLEASGLPAERLHDEATPQIVEQCGQCEIHPFLQGEGEFEASAELADPDAMAQPGSEEGILKVHRAAKEVEMLVGLVGSGLRGIGTESISGEPENRQAPSDPLERRLQGVQVQRFCPENHAPPGP